VAERPRATHRLGRLARRQDGDELLAADARDEVTGARAAAQDTRHLHEDLVAVACPCRSLTSLKWSMSMSSRLTG
jgi:hypothetical protein